ncbi:hypothetical protein CRE_01673 [Caenorhabditis remanei]|uniref:GH18 domain-containing protein n=1 Tax=Caenorhabditis remanei TaxID=31234 RepID=E3LH40_CAERE|nr:hypothetical protein CRE_01673 [Caenorhabditis remanei]
MKQFRILYREDDEESESCIKTTTIIFFVLFFCGVVAIGMAVTFFFLVDIWETRLSPDGNVPGNDDTSSPDTFDMIQADTASSKLRVIGYYSEFDAQDIRKSQLSKLTHAIVACVTMNSEGDLEFKENIEAKLKSMKKKSSKLKVMMSIGGWDNSNHFPSVMESLKKKFVNSIISFVNKNELDGVNIFWRTPPETHKFHYSQFLKTLREELDAQGKLDNKQYVISIMAPRPGIDNWESGFDLDEIMKYVDFINVLSMDYYAPWPNEWGKPVGPSAPLYSGGAPRKQYNVDYTMRYYIDETNQPEKFNLVIPFYVRLWKNVGEKLKESEVYRDVELKDGKVEGVPYMDRWTAEHEGWKLTPAYWDEKTKTSYIYNPENKTFLTFEDERSLAQKMLYVNERNLGGVWIWSVHTDDEDNTLLNLLLT